MAVQYRSSWPLSKMAQEHSGRCPVVAVQAVALKSSLLKGLPLLLSIPSALVAACTSTKMILGWVKGGDTVF